MNPELADIIANMRTSLATGVSKSQNLSYYLNSAGTWLKAHNYVNAGQALNDGSGKALDMGKGLATYYATDEFYICDAFEWIGNNLPETSEFDMAVLLSTMLAATPYQLEYFIGLVDAYRQSLWNKPFNAEFFGALAKGFEQWP